VSAFSTDDIIAALPETARALAQAQFDLRLMTQLRDRAIVERDEASARLAAAEALIPKWNTSRSGRGVLGNVYRDLARQECASELSAVLGGGAS